MCAGTIASAIACGSDTTGPALVDADHAFWALRLNYHAVNLALAAPYNSVQLTATPLNANGVPLTGVGTVTFAAGDSAVTVTPTGLVTAQYATASVNALSAVIATLQYQNVTLADTVRIQVTDVAPAPLTTFALRPVDGASTHCNLKVGILENCGPVVVDATDANGDTLANASGTVLAVAYASSNPLITTVDQFGALQELDTGRVTVTASTWAYGVAKQDSLHYVISWPRWTLTQIQQFTPVESQTSILRFLAPQITIAPGGAVAWINPYDRPMDIVFDDSTAVDSACIYFLCGILRATGSGNVHAFYTDTTYTDTSVFAAGIVVRSFPTVGTYTYHSRLFPESTGVIFVRKELWQ
jgi:hypothetical protein